uniref:Uncharacterized protein n=1 Tax=Rhizophora mucronata TaxID=61149 RepID=A0A2P2P643_RHIMU
MEDYSGELHVHGRSAHSEPVQGEVELVAGPVQPDQAMGVQVQVQ